MNHLVKLALACALGVFALSGCAVTPGADFSPDGSQVVVPWGKELHLHLASADGTRSERLPETAGAMWPSFSPNGRHVLFATEEGARLYDLDERRVVARYEEVTGPLVWRPDGRQFVAFTPTSEEQPAEARYFSLDAGEPVRRVALPFERALPDWTAVWAGEHLAVAAEGSGERHVFLIGPAGVKQISRSGDVLGLGSTPAGDRLVWAARSETETAGLVLFSYEVATGTVRRVPFSPILPGLHPREFTAERVLFSPGAGALALIGHQRESTLVYAAGLTDTRARRLERIPHPRAKTNSGVRVVTTAQWSRDGSRLAVVKWGPGPWVRVYPAASSQGVKLSLP